jgi:hypothetical protein
MKNLIIKKYLKLAILAIYILLSFLILTKPAAAYTGSIAIFPALTDGPDHTTITNIDIDTESQNPVRVTTNLNYVQSIVIETNPPVDTHLLIKEYPSGESVAFSFIVNQPFQDALVSATIYFWGPDVDSLQISHDHNGIITPISATKIQPVEKNAENNILWSFTTTSFSDFFTSDNFLNRHNRPNPLANWAMLSYIGLCLMCLSTYFVLRKN